MEHFKFFQNSQCEYFPCHEGVDRDTFNCLFCFCPLYMLGDQCGGNFTYNEKGIKDCSHCALPHEAGGYEYIMEKIDLVVELTKQK